MEPIKVFVLGRHPETLGKVLDFLRDNGYEADGHTENEEAFALFAQKVYDIVIVGGGVDTKTRNHIKKEFPATSPEIEFVEHYGDPTNLLGEIEEAFKE